jgi:hypothetical protein
MKLEIVEAFEIEGGWWAHAVQVHKENPKKPSRKSPTTLPVVSRTPVNVTVTQK